MRGAALALAIGCVSLAFAGPARAQEKETAAARALFEEGTQALDKGDWEVACPNFLASFALKPKATTLVNIAKCHAHAGKLTLAADDYRRALVLNEETATPARKKELADFMGEALRALEARMARLRIEVKAPPPDLRVTRDGEPLPEGALRAPIPLDPGEHVIVASAPGRKAVSLHVKAAEGESHSMVIELPPDVAPPPRPQAPGLPPPDWAQPRPSPPGLAGGAPAWAWVGGALGIAAGGVAVFFAVDGSRASCGGPCTSNRFTQADVDALNARRHRDLGLGLALGGVGAAGIAVGIAGVARAPSSSAPPARAASGVVVLPLMSPQIAGLGLRGAF